MKNSNCMAEATGTIIDLRVKGLDFPTIITVQYAVNDELYEIKESIKLKSEAIKIGFLPIGQKRVPVMGETRVGTKVRVLYDPEEPGTAYLPDNKGKANV